MSVFPAFPGSTEKASPLEHNRIWLWVALSFWAGCLCAPHLSGGLWLYGLLGIGLLLIGVLRRLGVKSGVCLVLCLFALGILRYQAAFDPPVPEPGSYEITGFVYGESKLNSSGKPTFTLGDITLNGEPVSGKAYCSVHQSVSEMPDLFDGAQISFRGNVYRASGKSGPSHMDFELWLKQSGKRFGITTYEAPVIWNDSQSAPVRDVGFRFREWVRQGLENVMGDSAHLTMALLFGDRSDMPTEEKEAFQTLGIAHIISVSGLQVLLFGRLLLAGMERMHFSRRKKSLLLPILLLAYSGLTGFSTASLRAVIIMSLSQCAGAFYRRADRLTSLSLAMLLILLFKPLQAASTGFLMSFAAAFSITVLEPPLRRRLLRLIPRAYGVKGRRGWRGALRRLGMGLCRSLAVSVAAQAGILLPMAAAYHQLPLYGILVNVLLISLVSQYLMPFLALLGLLSRVPLLGNWLGGVGAFLSGGLIRIIQELSSLPYASIRVASPSLPLVLGIFAAVLFASRLIRAPRGLHFIAAALALGLGISGAVLSAPEALRYIQLDAGQADSALLLSGSQTILFDTGDTGYEALDILQDEGRDIDALYLTHLHSDHAGGIGTLLDAGIPIHQVYMPVNAEEQQVDAAILALTDRLRQENIPITFLSAGDAQSWGDCSVEVLWPDQDTNRTGQPANDRSMALLIHFGQYTLLNGADVTGSYEMYYARGADVLKAPHHGSSSSSSTEYLSMVHPRYVLVTCTGTSRSLPSGDFLARVREANIPLLRTDVCGDITLTIHEDELRITPYKEGALP